MYRTLFYVNIYGSYKLLKTVRFFWPTLYYSRPVQLSLAIPPWVGAMSTSQRAVMLCGWGVKARAIMVRVWVAGKTV